MSRFTIFDLFNGRKQPNAKEVIPKKRPTSVKRYSRRTQHPRKPVRLVLVDILTYNYLLAGIDVSLFYSHGKHHYWCTWNYEFKVQTVIGMEQE